MRHLIPIFIFFLWLFFCIQGRPNPVPNDELDEKEALEEYEKNHNQVGQPRVKRHRRVRGPEDPEDQEILDELEGVFAGIRRRNRDIYPQKLNIFQKYIDRYSSHDDDSRDN